MAKFKVVGPRAVAGVEPGGAVSIDGGSSINVAALLAAGHVELVDEKPKPQPRPPLKKDVD